MKLAYKIERLLVTIAAGMVANVLMKRFWRTTRDAKQPPQATDATTTLPRIAAGAAAQAAVVSGVKAAADRIAAKRYAATTGEWPAS